MDITLIPAAFDDKTLMRSLMALYLYDFTEYTGDDINEHGAFEYHYLDSYWVEEDRHPFLLLVDGKIAGFVLVRDTKDEAGAVTHHLAEFFVMRKYRRQKIGRAAARQAFDHFPGKWEVLQIPNNLPGQAFWRKVIGEYTGGNYTEKTLEDGCVVQFFSTHS